MTAPTPPVPVTLNLGFAPDDGNGAGARLVFQALLSALNARDTYAAALAQQIVDLQTQLGGIATLTPARKVNAGIGLAGGGDLTRDRTLAIMANGVSNDLLAKVPTLTLKANLLGSTANAQDASVPALLDAVFGGTQGGLLYRSSTGWGPLALGANGTVLQSNGQDLVFGATPAGTSAVRADVAQTFTRAQMLQARKNIGAGINIVGVGASATILSGGLNGPIYVSAGGITVTLPSVAAAVSGDWLEIINISTGTFTVQRSASDTSAGSIFYPGNAASSIAVGPGQTLKLTTDGTNWIAGNRALSPERAVGVDAQTFTAAQQVQALTNLGVAPGAAGTVLTSNGAGAAATFQAPTAGASIVASSGNAASGYRKWSDGFIEQWMLATVNGDATVSFPVTFPNACRSVVGTVVTPYNGNALTVQTGSVTTTNFSAGARQIGAGSVAAVNIPVYFYACGY